MSFSLVETFELYWMLSFVVIKCEKEICDESFLTELLFLSYAYYVSFY